MLEKSQSRNGAIKRHPNVTAAAAGFNSRRNFYGDGIFSGEKRQTVNNLNTVLGFVNLSDQANWELDQVAGSECWMDGRMVGQ